jgi:cyanophycin synthetase
MANISYRHGLHFPSIDGNLVFKLPAGFNSSIVDEFILSMLRVAREDFLLNVDQSKYNKSSTAYNYLEYILLVQRSLLKIANLPIYHPAKILELSEITGRKDYYFCKVSIPFFDEIPLEFLRDSLKLAINILDSVFKKNPNPLTREIIDKAIQNKIVVPMRKLSCGGISTLPILKAAISAGLPVRHLGMGNYLLGWGSNSRKLSRSALDSDSAIGAEISSRKDHCAATLTKAGIPVPEHRLVFTAEQAIDAANQLGFPVVVKPTDRERSEGVTTQIHNEVTLLSAYEKARKISKLLLVERQIAGKCFRLLIASGEFLYSVERGPRALIGDGKHSVLELLHLDKIDNEAAPIWIRRKEIQLDEETLCAIKLAGYHLDSVPEAGKWVPVRIIESSEWSETSIDVTDQVHPANIQLAERSALVLGLSNAGVDLMTTDVTRPWWETGGIITEVNYRPHFGATYAASSRMQDFLNRIIKDHGRIHIEVFIGDELSIEPALARRQQLQEQGLNSYVCTPSLVFGPLGELKLAAKETGLYGICRVMLQDSSVEALVLIVQDDELLKTGLPFDVVDQVTIVPTFNVLPKMQLVIDLLQHYAKSSR